MIEWLRSLDPELRAAVAAESVRQYADFDSDEGAWVKTVRLLQTVGADLPGDPLAAERTAELEKLGTEVSIWWDGEVQSVAEHELAAGRPLSAPVVAFLRRCALEAYRRPEMAALAEKLTEPVLNVGEAWAERAMDEAAEGPWRALLVHAATATSARPTAQWDKTALTLVESLGVDTVRAAVLGWLPLVGRPRTFAFTSVRSGPDANLAFDPFNANALRGLTWILALLPAHPDTARALGTLVETSLKKVPGLGPVNPKVANAAVTALARIHSEAALAELARLASRVTYKGTLKLLNAALDTRAEALGLSREEVEELAVPAYGLTEVGRRATQLGDFTALLEIQGGKAVLRWHSATGKAVKSVPAAVRRDHPEALKELKTAVKDIDKMLGAQAERLDRQFLARRTWSYAAWRERCLDHPSSALSPAACCGRSTAPRSASPTVPCAPSPTTRSSTAPRSPSGTPSGARPPKWSPGGTGWSGTRSPSPSNRPTARCTCSPTPSARRGPTRTGSRRTSSASTSSTPSPPSAAGATNCGSASTTRRRPPPVNSPSGACEPSTGSRATATSTASTPPTRAAT